MMDVIKGILRSLGIKLEDVTTRRLPDYGKGEILTTDDWIMVFNYKDLIIAIELREAGSKEAYINIVKYEEFENLFLNLHRVELADMTAEKLREIIKTFIERSW